MSEEKSQEVIEKAHFIGLVKTESIETINSQLFQEHVRYILKPVWAYKGSLETLFVIDALGVNSCRKQPVAQGAYFDAVIYKSGDSYSLAPIPEHNFTGIQWQELKKKAQPPSEIYMKIEQECWNNGGKFIRSGMEYTCERKENDNAYR